jgi:hypothetical protein
MRHQPSRIRLGLGLVVVIVALGAAGCGDDGHPGSPCDYIDCSGRGTCSDQAGQPVCACESGYVGVLCQDCAVGYVRDASDTTQCVPGETCAVSNPCGDHGTCDDRSGVTTCTCELGYAEPYCQTCVPGYHDDGTGACAVDQSCLANTCAGHGTCDDGTGAPVCTCDAGYAGDACATCATGFHRNAEDQCVADASCATDDPCGDHGTCDDAGGVIVCVCEAGWTGEFCNQCYPGYHDDGTGACVRDETCLANTCSGHGACDESTGVVLCDCDAGYVGDACESCDAGFHRDGQGTCAADVACELDTCSGHGVCDDDTGVPVCTCDQGYTDVACNQCYPGYHPDGTGACVLDEQCQPTTCSGRGTCDATGGVLTCDCDDGYAGAHCEDCELGYHRDGQGACAVDVACETDTCSGHGVCDDDTGVPICACDQGYDGVTCADCFPGYHPDGTGACLLDDRCFATTCSGHGQCDDAGGVITCACDQGYAGAYCQDCALDHHRDAGLSCVPDESCAAADPCGTHGTCDDTTGVIVCHCATGYQGVVCDACYPGYHDDGTGACVLDEQCLSTSCSGHETDCSAAGGVVTCVCLEGYAGAHCELCATGYHYTLAGTCAADDVCVTDECGDHGACVVTDGVKACVCDAGWAGAACETCAAGYHRDATGLCVADTACLAGTCSGHGTCEVIGGVPLCTACVTGYAGARCELCASGYHLDGAACVADDVCAAGECGDHGTCEVVNGVKRCRCDAGYQGLACDACAAGYHLDGTLCVADGECLESTCSYHGQCDDLDGTPGCTCDAPAYTGEWCQNCNVGFHREAATGNCVADDVCVTGECGAHGTCVVNAGIKSCQCATGWAGTTCETCAAGYHRDATGLCVADTACEATTCSGHGTCEVLGGVPQCTACDLGYAGARCELCAPGFHASGAICVPDETCDPTFCSGHGACALVNGVRACQCDVGYAGATCADCYPGYTVNQITHVCEVPCDNWGWQGIRCNGECRNGIDRQNCGGCDISCGDGNCNWDWGSQTASCQCPSDWGDTSFALCGGVCTNLWYNEAHCGACGAACDPGEKCLEAHCIAEQPICEQNGQPCGDNVCCGWEQWGPEPWMGNAICLGWWTLRSDPQNCGGCGIVCADGAPCVNGACVVPTGTCDPACDPGATCCDDPVDGIDDCLPNDQFNWNTQHCGGCGITCGANEQCNSGACQCPSDWGDTSFTRCGGVCTHLQYSEQHCGACGNVCAAGDKCLDGHCVTERGDCASGGGCQEWQACCDSWGGAQCWDSWFFANQSSNCGGCGNTCAGAEQCQNFQCVCPTWDPRFAECNGTCLLLDNDEQNCGACGAACDPGQRCIASRCQEVDDGLCGGSCTEPQVCCPEPGDPTVGWCYWNEQDMNYDTQNCGGCGITCGTNEQCQYGTCRCPSDWGDPRWGWCGGQCISLVDPANCGGCGVTCGGAEQCADWWGTPQCYCPSDYGWGGYLRCGPENTCTDVRYDEQNCGGCGVQCDPGDKCIGGQCFTETGADCNGGQGCDDTTLCCDEGGVGQCLDDWTLRNDGQNCGGCGIACADGTQCQDGACLCPADQGNLDWGWCSGTCTSLTTTQDCGGCGVHCDPGLGCFDRICQVRPGDTCDNPRITSDYGGGLSLNLCEFADDAVDARVEPLCGEADASRETYLAFVAPGNGWLDLWVDAMEHYIVVGRLQDPANRCGDLTNASCNPFSANRNSEYLNAGEMIYLIVYPMSWSTMCDLGISWDFQPE